tara:strand:+ start:108 stop:1100 length:993 start_codon:yes stop_codon:yes gene_type:complete
LIKKQEIIWVFSRRNPDRLPSYVVSGILPANFLGILKIIFLKNHNASKTLDRYNPKLIILATPFHSDLIELVKEAKRRKIIVITTFDDWNFKKETEFDILQNELKLSISKYSDSIVVKTFTAAKFIKNQIGINADVIPDCLRFTNNDSIKKIDYPFNLSWFGMHTNQDTLKFGLKEIIDSKYKCKIKVITGRLNDLKNSLSDLNLKNIELDYIEWQPSMDQDVIKSDIVIIPYINDDRRLVKSQNRITDSMSMGRFVICSEIDFSKEFKKYCYVGNLGEGLDWVYNNRENAIKKAVLGKNYVDSKFNIEKISEYWINLINDIFEKFNKNL